MSNHRLVSALFPLLAALLVIILGSYQAGCGKNGENTFDDGGKPGQGGYGADGAGVGDDGSVFGETGPSTGALSIEPASPTIDVSIDNAGVHTTPLTFTAKASGIVVTATWSFDRAELGAIAAASGVFTASGQVSGVGNVSAKYGSDETSTPVTVRIHNVQVGGPADAGSNGLGGNGGVGGEGLGGSVDTPTMGRLRGGNGASPNDFAWLYPYDRTVWPRGILAPLLQWSTPHTATSVYIHLKEANFEFEGFYSGTKLVHQPIDQTAWKQALEGNSGDKLHVEITIADGSSAWGPIGEDWTVAPGVLKGTLYYNSYNTKLATTLSGQSQAAAILAIKSVAAGTTLNVAIPGAEHKCIVCHTLSADGSTLFAQEGVTGEDYSNGASYDLRNNSAVIASYTGSAPDGTTNDRKFLWSGPAPDGTYALQSSGHTQEEYGVNQGVTTGSNVDSRIFRRSDGNAVAAAGFDAVVKQAVTPSFSPDGKRVAFNFWTAQAGAPVSGGDGHTLDVMDFACGGNGVGGGGPSCSTFTFSNPRRLYTNPDSTNGFPAWPAWLPDGTGLVFHNTVTPAANGESPISTWQSAQAELWYVDAPASGSPVGAVPMYALNGKLDAQTPYLPTNTNHPSDTVLNYEPTINPVASGGYYWVVFTSRRMYGNVATGDPYEVGDGTYPVTKKLWVAAIDLHPTPGRDPSHPAFYLPGQEINAGNMRGYWVVDPCKANGSTCESGDECCNGFCRQPDDGGPPVCMDKPPQGCAQEFEKCTTTSDCCGATSGYQCLNGHCARPTAR